MSGRSASNVPLFSWHDRMDRIRGSCRKTSAAALRHSPDIRHWGKAAYQIAAVQVLLYHLLDHRSEIPVLLLETILIYPEEPLEIVIKHPVKHRVNSRQLM